MEINIKIVYGTILKSIQVLLMIDDMDENKHQIINGIKTRPIIKYSLMIPCVEIPLISLYPLLKNSANKAPVPIENNKKA